MPRPSNTEARRREIVEGLMAAMAQSGYSGASIQAIARAAGLTPGLVHYHFESKQEVLLALVEELSRRVRARYEARLAGSAEPWDRLRAFLDAHLALGQDADPRAVACWVAIGAEAVRLPEVRQVYEAAIAQQLETLQSLVREILVAEGRPTREARSLAAGLLAAIQGSYQLAVAAGATPRGFAAPTLLRMARGLLLGGDR